MELRKYYTVYLNSEVVNTKTTGNKKNIKEIIENYKNLYGKKASTELRKVLKHKVRA